MAHIEAEIWFLTHDKGGRQTPVATGYRPQFFYENEDWDAAHEYVGREDLVQLGEKVLTRLTFFAPEHHVGRVYVGMPFLVREGRMTVGYGVVTSLLELERAAADAARRQTTGG